VGVAPPLPTDTPPDAALEPPLASPPVDAAPPAPDVPAVGCEPLPVESHPGSRAIEPANSRDTDPRARAWAVLCLIRIVSSIVAIWRQPNSDIAMPGRAPPLLLRQQFGIWGQKLWLFANGQWSEKLVVEARTRTMISRQKTFSFDVRDYGRVQQFGVVEVKKLLAQLRREQLAPREISVAVRFADFSECRAEHRFRAAQERDGIICEMFAAKFSECVAGQNKLVRQLRLALGALSPMAARQEVFGDW